MEQVFFSEAVNRALADALAADGRVVLLGEDIGAKGGAFGVTRGLQTRFGRKRVVDTPISENSIVGLGVGAALTGLRPVVEIMYFDFIALALDPLLNKAVKLPYLTHGRYTVPLVIRTAAGGGRAYGPDHSQALEPLFMNIPGLNVAVPATPADAYAMLTDALQRNETTLFVEYKVLYGMRGPLIEEVPPAYGRGRVARSGSDVTLATFGRMVPLCMAAAGQLAGDGIAAEVLDLRYLKPLDDGLLTASVAKTGVLVTVEESSISGGIGAEIVATVTERCLYELDKPPLRLGARPHPVPFSPALESKALPTSGFIAERVREHLRSGK